MALRVFGSKLFNTVQSTGCNNNLPASFALTMYFITSDYLKFFAVWEDPNRIQISLRYDVHFRIISYARCNNRLKKSYKRSQKIYYATDLISITFDFT